jgi:streptogramin lyase
MFTKQTNGFEANNISSWGATKDGIWFTQTTGNRIGFFDSYTHESKNLEVPISLSLPIGIYAASDGGVWFLESLANKAGCINPSTSDIVEYPVQLSLTTPFTIRAETGGRYIWFTAPEGDAIRRIKLAKGK